MNAEHLTESRRDMAALEMPDKSSPGGVDRVIGSCIRSRLRRKRVMSVNDPRVSCYLVNNCRVEPVNLHFDMYKTFDPLR